MNKQKVKFDMHNLEKSRVMYGLSLAQLNLVQKSNYNY